MPIFGLLSAQGSISRISISTRLLQHLEKTCEALSTFHSFTGCDTISAFFGNGKLSACAVWMFHPAVTEAFRYIAENPFVAIDNFKLLERFTVVMYGRTSQVSTVDEARRALFCHRGRIMMDALPPTQGALLQHSHRAVYRASIWQINTSSKHHFLRAGAGFFAKTARPGSLFLDHSSDVI